MTTKPQILNLIKNLIYLLLFSLFLLISVAKKFHEIQATNFDTLCKTNPITKTSKINASAVLTKGYENKRPRRRGENKPKQTQFQRQIYTACRQRRTRCPP
jgi:hypothetical protein